MNKHLSLALFALITTSLATHARNLPRPETQDETISIISKDIASLIKQSLTSSQALIKDVINRNTTTATEELAEIGEENRSKFLRAVNSVAEYEKKLMAKKKLKKLIEENSIAQLLTNKIEKHRLNETIEIVLLIEALKKTAPNMVPPSEERPIERLVKEGVERYGFDQYATLIALTMLS